MKKSEIKKVTALLPKHISKEVFFALLCCAIASLTIIEPIVLSKLIESATNQFEQIRYIYVVESILIFVTRVGLTYYKQTSLVRYRNRCILQLSNKMVSHLLRVKASYYDDWTASYATSRVIDELSNINGILPRFLFDGILSAMICIIIFALMISQSWIIGLLTMAFVVADYFVAFRLPLTKIYKQYNETMANTKSQTNNLFQGIIQVKMGDSFQREEGIYDATLKKALNILSKKTIFSQFQHLTNSVCRQFGYLLVIVISAIQISTERITLAQFTMLLSLYNLFWNHTIEAENVIPLYKYGKVTSDRVFEVLEMDIENGIDCVDPHEKITSVHFKNVSFAYNQDRPILNQLTFSAQSGNIVALAGYSGCGKSTALKILLGFIDRDDGDIILNEQKADVSTLVSLRPKIAYIGQHSFLFNRSLRDNLLYYVADNSTNEQKVLEYIRSFALDEMVNSLPAGLDYVLGDNSNTISVGERQRLCIIRELMKEPDILIMDECTSSLDPETERKVFHILKKLSNNMVIIQVAHRPSALSYSDIVFVLENGCVVASGKHSSLLQTSSFYQTLLATMKNGV